MVKVKVRELAERDNIKTIKALSDGAGIAYDTAADLWYGRLKRLDFETITKVCRFFKCRIEDVLEVELDRLTRQPTAV